MRFVKIFLISDISDSSFSILEFSVAFANISLFFPAGKDPPSVFLFCRFIIRECSFKSGDRLLFELGECSIVL